MDFKNEAKRAVSISIDMINGKTENCMGVAFDPSSDTLMVRYSDGRVVAVHRQQIIEAMNDSQEGFSFEDAKTAWMLACNRKSRIHLCRDIQSIEIIGPKDHYASTGPFNCYRITFTDGTTVAVPFCDVRKEQA